LRQAAGVLGIEPSAYRAWEQDFSKPRADKADALAAFLRLTKADVLGLLGILSPDEVEALRMSPRNPTPARAKRKVLPSAAAQGSVTIPEEQGAYLSGPISVPILALVA
jgi:transcriptional regulator with XRE-family HTH domain